MRINDLSCIVFNTFYVAMSIAPDETLHDIRTLTFLYKEEPPRGPDGLLGRSVEWDVPLLPARIVFEEVSQQGLVVDMEENHDDLARLAAESFPKRPMDWLVDDVGDPSRGVMLIE